MDLSPFYRNSSENRAWAAMSISINVYIVPDFLVNAPPI
jgi:hypothetical protein